MLMKNNFVYTGIATCVSCLLGARDGRRRVVSLELNFHIEYAMRCMTLPVGPKENLRHAHTAINETETNAASTWAKNVQNSMSPLCACGRERKNTSAKLGSPSTCEASPCRYGGTRAFTAQPNEINAKSKVEASQSFRRDPERMRHASRTQRN